MAEGLSPVGRRNQDHRTSASGPLRWRSVFDGEDDLIDRARKGPRLPLGYGDNEDVLGQRTERNRLSPMTDRVTLP